MSSRRASVWGLVPLACVSGGSCSTLALGQTNTATAATFEALPAEQTSLERAREYFVRGGAAASRQAWGEAIDLYLESYLQYPHPSTLHTCNEETRVRCSGRVALSVDYGYVSESFEGPDHGGS